MSPKILHRDRASLVVIDFQEKLAATMKSSVRERTLANASILLRGMQTLEIPVLVTEQYPKGLGATVPELSELLGGGQVAISKVAFSCCQAEGFAERLEALGRKQVVLCGMEAHICVLQTSFDLLRAGYDVWVAEDAICSRRKLHWKSAVRQLENAGVDVTPVESILFTLLGEAGTDAFKAVSKLVR